MTKEEYRNKLRHSKRVVVKIGSRVLARSDGTPDRDRIESIAEQIAKLQGSGKDVILVSSGAIGAGMGALGLKTRPGTLPDLQMCAAIGQSRLVAQYDNLFSKHGCKVGQVLLTHDGLKQRERHLNARNTILTLMRNGIIPVVNENDAVAVDDIRFGDNDILAALVSILVDADLLVLLTTVNGLRREMGNNRTKRVEFLSGISEQEMQLAHGKGGEISTGGMASKLQAARTAAETGADVVIADGRMRDVILRLTEGEDVGTLITSEEGPQSERKINRKKRWIAFFHRTKGALIVDDGARKAIEQKGKSLLPIGIKKVEGTFPVGSSVQVKSGKGTLIARGLVEYSSEEIEQIKGFKTGEIAKILGEKEYDEVIHRDNMVLLKPSQEGLL